MIVKIVKTTCAGFTPVLKPSSPAHAFAWAPETDVASPKRRRSGRFALLLTALSFILCLTTFSVSAQGTKAQLQIEIASAELLLDTTRQSLNGWDIPLDTAWFAFATAGNLQTVIDTALYYVDVPGVNYDPYILALSDAQVQYKKSRNPSGLQYDYTQLTHAIATAEDSISPAKFAVSATGGLDVPGTKRWASQVDLDAFKEFIKNARNVMVKYRGHGQAQADARINQIDINDTANVLLLTRLPAFLAPLQYGYMPDYSDLMDSIASAKYLLDTIPYSTSGGNDVPPSASWVSEPEWIILKDSVEKALEFVRGNKGATGPNLSINIANVSDQIAYLSAAKAAFMLDVTQGQGTPDSYNYLVLNGAIADARAALELIKPSLTGDDISPDSSWITPADWNVLNDSVIEYVGAKNLSGVYGSTAPDAMAWTNNQQHINEVTNMFRQLTADLRSDAQYGYKPNYNPLNELIDLAQEMLDDSTGVSVDGREYEATEFWALALDRNTLQDSINIAKGHVSSNDLAQYGNWIANQNAVDSSFAVLNDAYNVFLTQRHQGDKYDPAEPKFLGLPSEITKVENLMDTVFSSEISYSGADVPYGTSWIYKNDSVRLATYLTNASDMVADPDSYTNTQICTLFDDLSTAIGAVTPQMGRGANTAVLKEWIAVVQLLADSVNNGDILVSASGIGDDTIYIATKNWVTQEMVDTVTNVLADAIPASAYEPPVLHAPTITSLESRLRNVFSVFIPQPFDPDDALADTTVLIAECDRLYNLVDPLVASSNGDAAITTGVMWVPLSDKTDLLDSIASARTATYVKHSDVLDRIDDLNSAYTALLASQRSGAKPPYIVSTPQKFPDGFVGAVYNTRLVDAGLPNVAFSISSGALPTGLSLDASSTGVTPTGSGKLIGKTTRAGTFNFTVQATHNSMTPAVTETLSHTIKIYDVPAIVPTESDYVEEGRVGVQSDIVIRFPYTVPMNTNTGTVTLNGRPVGDAYWTTDTTFVIPHPVNYYEYETDYVLNITGLVSKDGLLNYERSYAFRTTGIVVIPPIPHLVKILPLSDGVMSDPPPGEYFVSTAEDNKFSLKLTVPADMTPTLLISRTVNDEVEELTGVPDPEMPETRFLFTILQIHQPIDIAVALSPRNASANEIVGNDVRVWASGGKLYVETPQPGSLSVYNITGVLQIQKSVTGSSVIPLSKGIYIVRLNEKAYKIVVP